jgi:hypothetical protein
LTDLLENYLLEDDEWKYDKLPEIMDGKNVYDLYPPTNIPLTIVSILKLKPVSMHWKKKKNVSKQKDSTILTKKL